uniref:Neurokinin-B n=1 Tax=Neolamprologus brichardi TaxID=32507 RepID=A0A3Q4HLU7_NEOBR
QFSEVMEGTHFSLVALSIFILLTVRCCCEEEQKANSFSLSPKPGSDRDLKGLDDIGYDSFLGLMGRRNAALTNRDTDHSLADLLGWRTSECLWNQ